MAESSGDEPASSRASAAGETCPAYLGPAVRAHWGVDDPAKATGTDAEIDGYSAFFENDHRTSTGLTEFLRTRKVTEVYIMGFSPDGCALYTALDAQALGFKTFYMQDAVRTAPQTEAERQADEALLKESGVTLVRAQDML